MTYVMSKEMYDGYTKIKPGYKGLKDPELIKHINENFGLRGEITKIRIDE